MVQVIGPSTQVEDLINDPNFDSSEYYGYVYCTLDITTGKRYIGKKAFFHKQNKKLLSMNLNFCLK